MTKRLKRKLCVCSLVDKLGILHRNQLEGEIYFKYSAECPHKSLVSYEWREDK